MKTLLEGKPYVRSDQTDLRKTFARVRKQLQQEKDKRERELNNILKMPRRA